MTDAGELSILLPVWHLDILAALEHAYPEDEAGRECLRQLPVVINQSVIDHLRQDHPERMQWFLEHRESIRRAIASPEFIEKHLNYRDKMDHWATTVVVPDSEQNGKYVAVALSLARVEDEESEFHQVITAHPIRYKDLFKRSKDGDVLKDRWIHVKPTKN